MTSEEKKIIAIHLGILGNGNFKKGVALLARLGRQMAQARLGRPVFAEGPYQALGRIGEGYDCFAHAVTNRDFAQTLEAEKMAADILRYLNEEHHPEIGEE